MGIKKVLADHAAWLAGKGGECANLSGVDLRFVNLSGVDLRGADLSGANLSGTNLSGVDLRGVDLRFTNLRGANLRGANLRGANLSGANLPFTNLSDTNLRYANLSDTNLSGANLLVLHLPLWTVYIHEKTIRIGCKHFTHEEWQNFTDEDIDRMDSDALSWWKTYKPMIMEAAKTIKKGGE